MAARALKKAAIFISCTTISFADSAVFFRQLKLFMHVSIAKCAPPDVRMFDWYSFIKPELCVEVFMGHMVIPLF
jgi:hypothetical protein